MGVKNRKYKNRKRSRSLAEALAPVIVLLFVAFLSLLLLLMSDTMPGAVFLLRCLYSAIPLYFALLHADARHLNIAAKASMILVAVVFWTSLLPGRICALIDVMIFFAECALVPIAYTARKVHTGPVLALTYSLLALMTLSRRTTYLHNPGVPHFLPLCLSISVISGFGFWWLLKKEIIHLDDDRLSERICAVILVAALGFGGAWSSLDNLNYALDTSKAANCPASVCGKRVSSGKSTSYYLQVYYEGEKVDMLVNRAEYEQASVGDKVTLRRFDGAFSDPYYTLDLSIE